jgi:hypothetical protein
MSSPAEFEGDVVNGFFLQLPSARIECLEPYSRGTYLDMKVRVRVKSVLLEPNKDGDLSRRHVLVVEECGIVNVETPGMLRAQAEAALAAQEEAQLAHEEALRNYTVEEHPHAEDWDTMDLKAA